MATASLTFDLSSARDREEHRRAVQASEYFKVLLAIEEYLLENTVEPNGELGKMLAHMHELLDENGVQLRDFS